MPVLNVLSNVVLSRVNNKLFYLFLHFRELTFVTTRTARLSEKLQRAMTFTWSCWWR